MQQGGPSNLRRSGRSRRPNINGREAMTLTEAEVERARVNGERSFMNPLGLN